MTVPMEVRTSRPRRTSAFRFLLPLACMLVCGSLLAVAPPPDKRLSPARIAEAEAYSRSAGGSTLIVMQAGAVLHESGGTALAEPIWTMSIAKSLTAMAIFAARADGLLTLDEPASKTLGEWKKDGRKAVTIRQLLNHTSGLADGYNAIYARGVKDKARLALGLRLVDTPGARFDYGPGNYEVLGEILRRKLAPGGRTPLGYLRAKVLTPLGITPADWRKDGSGNPFQSAGAKLTPRDLAKIGEFVRTRGRAWIVPVIPQSAFDGAFTGSSANSMYGLGFWLNANARETGASPLSIEGTLGQERSPAAWRRSCISPVAPPDLVAMVGSGGIRVYVVPSRKLVIVRTGQGGSFSDATFLGRLFR
jgi:Beta-lactamase class C and other penicillin binding proteins